MEARAFGRYEVLARLATGGTANIFLARQPGLEGFRRAVVVKTLLPDRAADDAFVAMFLDEARLAARLAHPACVQIFDLGRVRGLYYIAMEYICGETLWNLLGTVATAGQRLPPADVAAIVAAASDGLHHAHELRDATGRPYHLVHRDVSPQNIMVSFEGQTKVVDFGIAKAETGRDPTRAGVVKGKFSYMSPEQIAGGDVDRRSDVFSLGIVLFECLAARRLFRGDSPEQVAELILRRRVPRLSSVVPDVPAALDDICARALEPRLGRRFQTALEMGDALRNYLDEVRHPQNARAVGALCEARFGAVIHARRRAVELALAADGPAQPDWLSALGAGPVRDVDLFPGDAAESEPDFVESPKVPSLATEGTETSLAARFRVELEPAGPPERSIELASPDTLVELAELDADARTRPLPPKSEALGPAPSLVPMDGPLAGAWQLDAAAGPPQPSASSRRGESEISRQESTEASTEASVLGAFQASSSRVTEFELATALPDRHRPVVEPAGLSPRRVLAPTPSPSIPTPPVVVAPVAEPARFGVAALVAALMSGVALGLVLGLLLARVLFLAPG